MFRTLHYILHLSWNGRQGASDGHVEMGARDEYR